MGLDFDFTISQRMEAKLRRLSETAVSAVITEALNRTLDSAVEMVKESVPQQYERTRDSIRVISRPTSASLRGSIGSSYKQAYHAEFGTGLYDESPGATKQAIDIYPVNKKVLRFETKDGQVVFTKHVHYKGREALAMFRKNRARIQHLLNRNVKAAVDQFMGSV